MAGYRLEELAKIKAIMRTGFVMVVVVPLIFIAIGYVRTGLWMFVGGMIGMGNFYLLQVLVTKLLNALGQKKKKAVFAVYFCKMLFLLGGVGIVCYWFPVEPIGFMLGFGFVLLAIVGVGFFYLIKGVA